MIKWKGEKKQHKDTFQLHAKFIFYASSFQKIRFPESWKVNWKITQFDWWHITTLENGMPQGQISKRQVIMHNSIWQICHLELQIHKLNFCSLLKKFFFCPFEIAWRPFRGLLPVMIMMMQMIKIDFALIWKSFLFTFEGPSHFNWNTHHDFSKKTYFLFIPRRSYFEKKMISSSSFNDDRTFHFWLPQKFIKYRRIMTIEN